MTQVPTKLTLVAERNTMAQLLIEAATSRGWELEYERDRDRCKTVILKGPRLGLMVHLDGGCKHLPLLHWSGAKGKLRGVPCAWSHMEINPYHRDKATSFPRSLEQLLSMATAGIEAANDGSAFLIEND